MERKLCDTIKMSMSELASIWRETGIKGEVLQARQSRLLNDIEKLLADNVDEERIQQQQIIDSIKCHQANIQKMSDELGQYYTTEVYDW